MQKVNLDPSKLLALETGKNPPISTPGISLENPLNTDSFTTLLDRIIGFLIAISIPIAAAMIVWGGFQIMTAGGNPSKISEGKNTILYAVIGLTIVLIAWGIVKILEKILGVTSIR